MDEVLIDVEDIDLGHQTRMRWNDHDALQPGLDEEVTAADSGETFFTRRCFARSTFASPEWWWGA